MSLTFRDTVLPSQEIMRKEFEGNEEQFYTALYASLVRFSGLKSPTEEFQLQQSDAFTIEDMASSPMLARFLQTLILLKRPARVLEIGAFLGITTMQMARALPPGGQVLTIEKYDHFARLARNNFRANGLDDRIMLIEGDAAEILGRLDPADRFEMIFLDGNKERYADYFELLDPRVPPGGLIVVDDVLYHGDVLNKEPRGEKGIGVRKLLEMIASKRGYHRSLLPLSNGVLLLVKEELA